MTTTDKEINGYISIPPVYFFIRCSFLSSNNQSINYYNPICLSDKGIDVDLADLSSVIGR
jgi:hypothetical protein